MDKNIQYYLGKITEDINQEYGFEGTIPRINYGPCGVFSYIFYHEWNALFSSKVHICFIMTKDLTECDHVCIVMPDGQLYDGGIGIHDRKSYNDFVIEEMVNYDHALLDRWSYGLDRTYPRYCPNFNKEFVLKVITENLNELMIKG